MLSDSSHEIRQQADSALSEFLQEIKNSPVRFLLCPDLRTNQVENPAIKYLFSPFSCSFPFLVS